MKLRGKFNLMLLVVFGLALAASGYFSYKQLTENARDEVLSNAGVLMETIFSGPQQHGTVVRRQGLSGNLGQGEERLG